MPTDKSTAVRQIDTIFDRRKELEGNWSSENVQEITTRVCSAIKRLAPPGSAYLDQMERIFEETLSSPTGKSKAEKIELSLQAVLRALRADYEAGHLQTFQELIHADLFSDFLEMAEYFLQEEYKDPAAVLAGGVLEEHLRKLCGKHDVTIPMKPNLNTMNSELAKAVVYNKNDQKQVTAWAGLRNDAAHGNYANYTDGEVKLMAAGIRDFISRNPA